MGRELAVHSDAKSGWGEGELPPSLGFRTGVRTHSQLKQATTSGEGNQGENREGAVQPAGSLPLTLGLLSHPSLPAKGLVWSQGPWGGVC